MNIATYNKTICMMKRIFSSFMPLAMLAAVMSLCICSCSSDDDNEDSDILPPEGEEEVTDTIATVAVLDSAELYCTKGEQKIYGYIYKKVKAGEKAPAVILSHSSSLTHEAMKDYARAIADKGYVAYCFDFCGGSSQSKSDGSTDDMTVFTEVDDLKAVIDDICRLPEVDADNVFLLGSSQGGLVSALTAEELAQRIKGLILFYPAFNIPEMVKMFAGFMGGGSWGGGSWGGGNWGNWGDFGDWGDFGNMGDMFSMSETYINAIKDYDVWSHIGGFDRQVLILHGTQDIIVPISNSEKAVTIYPHATLQRIEGANHGFNEANLGGFGSMMGGSTTNYDGVVMPFVFKFLEDNTK